MPLLGLAGCATNQTPSTNGSSTTAVANTVAAGPMMGYAWDQAAGGLRPILGLPGASYLGAPVYNDGSYTAGAACGQKGFALLTGTKGDLFFATLPTGIPTQLAAKLSAKQQIAMSPRCATAIVYAGDATEMLLVQGLPTAPTVKAIPNPSSRPIVGAAVADSGAVLFATTKPDGTVSIDAIRSDGTAVPPITSLSNFGGMAFLPSLDNALIADLGKNVVWLQTGLNGSGGLAQIAAVADGVAQPSAIASSADARWAIVLNGGASILRIDLAKKMPPEKIVCNCSPTELVPLSGNLVFRLNEVGPNPMWAFDGDMSNSRFVFIPGTQRANPTGAAQ